MAFDVVSLALDFIAAYGLIAIFILLVLDGALLLPVFPGEIVLIMAVAAYAHDINGLIFLIILTTAAGLLGSLLLYGICRGGGRKLVDKYPRLFMMPRKRRERLEQSFRHPAGQTMVLFLRLVPLTRILVNIPAGLAKMPVVRFLILSTIGLAAYHAAFLWFTYEANRPGSAIATQKEQLQTAYASPAWDFVQANSIATGAVVLAIGAVFSIRASMQMYKDPEETTGSLIGSLSQAVLLWGGIGLAVMTYVDPEAIFAFAAVGGVDIAALAAALGIGDVVLLWAIAGVAILFGFILQRMRAAAKRRRKRREHLRKAAEARQRDDQIRQSVGFRPVAPPTIPPSELSARERARERWKHHQKDEDAERSEGPS